MLLFKPIPMIRNTSILREEESIFLMFSMPIDEKTDYTDSLLQRSFNPARDRAFTAPKGEWI